jgi:hypothetical protein
MHTARSLLTLLVLLSPAAPAFAQARFRRGDSNGDGTFNISDPIHTLAFLFTGGVPPRCRDAADANDDGAIDVSDAPFSLSFLFLRGSAPRAPFPDCGPDPTADRLDCEVFAACPQGPSFPRPEPDPCALLAKPCESAVAGPYTLLSTPDGPGVLTTATHLSGEVVLFRWEPAGDGAADLTIGVPESASLEPLRIDVPMPALETANALAAVVLLLNTAESALDPGMAAIRRRSGNHAGCDPKGLMGWADCTPCGSCCDIHDACIHSRCTAPTDSGDVRECVYRALAFEACRRFFSIEECFERYPPCSLRCWFCHLSVTFCFATCMIAPRPGGGLGSCCLRGNCGLPQQCVVNGVVQTDRASCPRGEADGWGDPHLVTFDRLAYDFQAAGEFVLVRSLEGDLEVQIRTEPWRSSRHVTVITAAALDVGGDRVEVGLQRLPALHVNGSPLVPGAGPVLLPGGGTIELQQGAYRVLWPDGSQVRVTPRAGYLNLKVQLSGERREAVEGLLGDFDGVRENDLTSRAGQVLGIRPTARELYAEYGESWRILAGESLFDYEEGESTETFTDRGFPAGLVTAASLTPEARRLAETACSGVNDPHLREACILDVGLTGEPSFAESAVEVAPPEAALDPPPCGASIVHWVDWTSGSSTMAEGTAAGVAVAFSGDLTPPPIVSGGTNYWASSSSTYTSPGIVDSPPPASDIIRLTGGPATGVQMLTFSSPVLDPVMAILSLGRQGILTTYEFDTEFEILTVGPGAFGNGTLTRLDGNVLGGREGHGLIRFRGLVSAISWTIPAAESWHGFQVGWVECR